MHLELTSGFKTSPLPIDLLPLTPVPKFFAPTPAIGKMARNSVPRNATITGYQVEGTHFRVFYVHRAINYSASIKIPRKNI